MIARTTVQAEGHSETEAKSLAETKVTRLEYQSGGKRTYRVERVTFSRLGMNRVRCVLNVSYETK